MDIENDEMISFIRSRMRTWAVPVAARGKGGKAKRGAAAINKLEEEKVELDTTPFGEKKGTFPNTPFRAKREYTLSTAPFLLADVSIPLPQKYNSVQVERAW